MIDRLRHMSASQRLTLVIRVTNAILVLAALAFAFR